MTYRSGPATEADAAAIVPMLRDVSREDLIDVRPDDLGGTVARIAAGSAHNYCGADDAGPLFIGGAVPVPDDRGAAFVWLVMAERVSEHRVFALREVRRQVGLMSQRWAVLRNYTDDRHPRTRAWLQWLGFTIGAPMPHPHTGRLVRPFERRTEHV